jgi:hypothetical protein
VQVAAWLLCLSCQAPLRSPLRSWQVDSNAELMSRATGAKFTHTSSFSDTQIDTSLSKPKTVEEPNPKGLVERRPGVRGPSSTQQHPASWALTTARQSSSVAPPGVRPPQISPTTCKLRHGGRRRCAAARECTVPAPCPHDPSPQRPPRGVRVRARAPLDACRQGAANLSAAPHCAAHPACARGGSVTPQSGILCLVGGGGDDRLGRDALVHLTHLEGGRRMSCARFGELLNV